MTTEVYLLILATTIVLAAVRIAGLTRRVKDMEAVVVALLSYRQDDDD